MKLTTWFPGTVKPARIGEYNASLSFDSGVRRWWDGRRWSVPYRPSYGESYNRVARSRASTLRTPIPWRGLAEKPQ